MVIVAAVFFLPKEGEGDGADPATPPAPSETREAPMRLRAPRGGHLPRRGADRAHGGRGATPDANAPEVAEGFTLRKDAEGFQVAVAKGWQRQPRNGRGQVVYTNGSFELIVVPGRDSTSRYGDDLLKYQLEHERELDPYRASSWTTSQNLRLIEVGGRSMAEGTFTWDSMRRHRAVRPQPRDAGRQPLPRRPGARPRRRTRPGGPPVRAGVRELHPEVGGGRGEVRRVTVRTPSRLRGGSGPAASHRMWA